MSSLRTKPLVAATSFVAITVSVAMSGGAPTSASVENGNRRIDIQFSNPGDQDVGGIAVTDDGTVIVAGATDDDFAGAVVGGADDDALLYATNESGEIEWAVVEDGDDESIGNEDEYFNDVIVHSNGYIYAVGQINGDGGTNGQAAINRYWPSGEFIDQVVWDDPGDTTWDEAQSLVEGPDHKIYVVGYSGGDLPDGHTVLGDHDAFVAVINPDLSDIAALETIYWVGDAGDDRAYSIDVDGAGNLYIAGRSDDTDFDGSLNTGGVWDWYVAKIDNDGDLVDDGEIEWFQFGGLDVAEGEDGDDRAWDVEFSAELDVLYVGGYLGNSPRLGGAPEDLSQQGFVTYLHPDDGTFVYASSVGLCGCNDSEVKTVVIDHDGHAITSFSLDGDDAYNQTAFGPHGEGIDSGVIHTDGGSFWNDYLVSSGDDEIMNSIIDDSGNLWLVGETSGDFAASRGGDDDIFLSLYRVRDPRRTSRSNNNSASWSVLSGTDRFDSSIVASRTSAEGGSVILVNGRNQVDLLLASMLDSSRTESLDGRVLFVEAGATQVPESLRIEWERLAPSAVTVIGGPDSVSDEFLAALANGSVPTTRVQASQVVARILDSSVAGTSLVLVGDDEPTNALQAVSWANAVGGTVLPLSAALYELDRLKAIGFSSVTLVGSPDVSGLAALAFIESSLGLTAQKVSSASPSDQSAAMATVVGSRSDVAVVSPTRWVDAVHANAMRLPLIWAGPECVQPGATAALASLSPTNSIRGFGGAMATLGDPRSALRC